MGVRSCNETLFSCTSPNRPTHLLLVRLEYVAMQDLTPITCCNARPDTHNVTPITLTILKVIIHRQDDAHVTAIQPLCGAGNIT